MPEQFLGLAVDVERRRVTGELLPDDGVDAAHQLGVAPAQGSLDLRHPPDDQHDVRARGEVDQEGSGRTVGMLHRDQEPGSERADHRRLCGDAATERHGIGGVDREHDQQQRNGQLGCERHQGHGDDLVAVGDDGCQHAGAPHDEIADGVVGDHQTGT